MSTFQPWSLFSMMPRPTFSSTWWASSPRFCLTILRQEGCLWRREDSKRYAHQWADSDVRTSSHCHTVTPSQIQEIHADAGTVLAEYIRVINSCYPEEIVRYMWGRRGGGGGGGRERQLGGGGGVRYCLLLSFMYPFPGLWREGGEMFVKPITKQKLALVNIFLLSMSFTRAGSCRRFNNEWWTNDGYSRVQWSVHLWCGVKLPCLPPSKDNGGKEGIISLSLLKRDSFAC